MKFSESLKKNRDFQYVYKNGKSYANKCLVMYIIPNEQNKNRVGISVSKKVGNSVVRHHLTRLIREREVAHMKRILLWMIRFYRKYLSKMKRYNTCKYYPTCSQYALEAIEKYGALKGGVLAIWRVLRCNPFSKGGYDPVP